LSYKGKLTKAQEEWRRAKAVASRELRKRWLLKWEIEEMSLEPMQLVHVDLDGGSGFKAKAFDGPVGAFVFRCDATNYYYVRGCKRKSEFPRIVREFVQEMWARYRLSVRVVRTDGAGENENVRAFRVASDENFVIDITSPGTPQENGGAEKGVGDTTKEQCEHSCVDVALESIRTEPG
jgi:hypothetical protein